MSGNYAVAPEFAAAIVGSGCAGLTLGHHLTETGKGPIAIIDPALLARTILGVIGMMAAKT